MEVSKNQFFNPVDLNTPDIPFEDLLRPRSFSEFIGQQKICERLELMVQAAKQRGDVLEHILLRGPPGIGKSTLAHILANSMETNFKATSGPMIERLGDLVGILATLERGDILFMDEIDRLEPAIEEYLYPAMENFRLDIVVDEGPNARSIRLNLPRFTLVGATSHDGSLSAVLRSRFRMTCRLEYYTAEELVRIVTRSAVFIGVSIDGSTAAEIAARSRGTPRIANNLLRLDGPRLGLTIAIRRSAWREVQLILTKELWALAEARPDFEELPDWIVHIEAASVAVEQGRAIIQALADRYGDEADRLALMESTKKVTHAEQPSPSAPWPASAPKYPPAGTITFKADGTWHLSVGDQGCVRVFDTHEHAQKASDRLKAQYGPSLLHPDSRLLHPSSQPSSNATIEVIRKLSVEAKPSAPSGANLEEFAPFLSDAIQQAAAFRKGVRRLSLAIQEGVILLGRHTRISFNRTLRIPEDGREYPLPAGFGRLPILRVEDYPDRVPEKWLAEGGFIIPLYQREALYLEFSGANWRPTIAKVAVGRVNAISGKDYDLVIRPHRQDYIVIPDQRWLDGINSARGSVSQFVAMPLGKGYTIEAQITDEEKHGGFQLAVFDPKTGRFSKEDPSEKESAVKAREQRSLLERQRSLLERLPEPTAKIVRAVQKYHCSEAAKILGMSEEEIRRTIAAAHIHFERVLGPHGFDGVIPAEHLAEHLPEQAHFMPGAQFMPGAVGDRSSQPVEMGIGAGGRIKQQIIEDPYGVESWDETAFREVPIHIVNSAVYKQITGLEPPPSPITLAHYQACRIPWYSDYKEETPIASPAGIFKRVLSIGQIERSRGMKEVTEPLHREIRPEEILRIRTQTLQERVTALYQRARQSLNCGRYRIAAREASLALDIVKNYPPLYLIRAHANLSLGFYSDAEADSSACLKLEPHNLGALKIRSRSALMLGELMLAKIDAAKMLESDPVDITALYVRAQANIGMAEYAEALADAEKILRQDHSHAEALRIRSEAMTALSKGPQ